MPRPLIAGSLLILPLVALCVLTFPRADAFVSGPPGTIATFAGGGVGDGGAATTAGLFRQIGVALDGSGNVYVADTYNCRVRKIVAGTGTISTIAGNGVCDFAGDGGAATAASLQYPGGVAVDASGNVYIADTSNQRIRRVDHTTFVITTVAGTGTPGYTGDNGPATSAELQNPGGVAVDGTGNIFIADTDNCAVRKISGGTITTFAGKNTCGFSGDGHAATQAALQNPGGVAVDGSGNVYIADTYNCRIRRVVTGTINSVAGSGTCAYAGDGGSPTAAALQYPNAVAVDGSGNFYIADTYNCRVRLATASTITTFAGGATCGFFGDGGAPGSALLQGVFGVAVGSSGVYIADTWNCRVRRVASGTINTFAGDGSCGAYGDGGPAAGAALSLPKAVAIDGAGNVYISDSSNCRVRKVTSGVITTVAGNGTCAYAGDNGPAISASLRAPYGIALDANGNLFIADSGNCRVREVVGTTINTIAGNGTCGYSGDGITATSTQLNFPRGVAVDGAGNVYIGDSDNCRIRVITGTTISTIAGTGSCGYNGEGTATGAQLNHPFGLAAQTDGTLYVADFWNCRVRKIAGGAISTVAGNGVCGYVGDGVPATGTEINWPHGVAIDGAGAVYIADTFNCRVRKVNGGTITTIAGIGTSFADGSCQYAGDGGTAIAAKLFYPRGVAVDGAGNVFIADETNNRVRIVFSTNPPTPTSTPSSTPVPPTSTPTNTPTRTPTNTPVPSTATPTNTPSATATSTPTRTPVPPTVTFTSTPTATNTPVPTATHTPTPTDSPTATGTDTSTATATAVIDPTLDTDGDGCYDVKEPQLVPPTDPNNPWDFYNVPVPALFAAPDPTLASKDHAVGASDAQAVFGYFKKAAKVGSPEYEQDLNGNGIKDGIEYDRSFLGPAQSGPPDGVIGASDAQLAFAQFKLGYAC